MHVVGSKRIRTRCGECDGCTVLQQRTVAPVSIARTRRKMEVQVDLRKHASRKCALQWLHNWVHYKSHLQRVRFYFNTEWHPLKGSYILTDTIVQSLPVVTTVTISLTSLNSGIQYAKLISLIYCNRFTNIKFFFKDVSCTILSGTHIHMPC